MLVERFAVEAGECEGILREVPRNPVHDHAEAGLVQAVDEVAQVVGGAEAARRRVVARHLIAPRSAERVLGERQELDVRVAHLGEIVDEGLRRVAVAEARAPRAEMQFVGRHRLVGGRAARSRGHPLVVAPRVRRLGDDRRRRRRHLRPLGHRVGLQDPVAVRGEDLVLVHGARTEPRHEQLPHAGGAEAAHRVRGAVPAVEVADDPHGAGVGGPDGERDAGHPGEVPHMGAEDVPELFVAALTDQVLVHLAERRQVPVRVVAAEVGAAVVGRDELVGGGLARRATLPDAAAHVLQRHLAAVGGDRRDGLRHRTAGADRPRPVRERVRAEHVVRGVVRTRRDGVPDGFGNVLDDGAHGRFLTCRMWTGSTNASRRTKAS